MKKPDDGSLKRKVKKEMKMYFENRISKTHLIAITVEILTFTVFVRCDF